MTEKSEFVDVGEPLEIGNCCLLIFLITNCTNILSQISEIKNVFSVSSLFQMMKSLSLLALVAAGAVAQKPARSVFIKCLFSRKKIQGFVRLIFWMFFALNKDGPLSTAT